MAQHRLCASEGCKNTVRVKYRFCEACRGKGIRAAAHAGYEQTVIPGKTMAPPEPPKVETDLRHLRDVREISNLKARYKEALDTIEKQQTELDVVQTLRANVDPVEIVPRYGEGTSEATPVVLFTDWHAEERVDAKTVSGLNEFNLDIFNSRSTEAFQGAHRLIKLLNQDVKIHTVICGLLGDFITNQIHGAENAETNQLQPSHAIVMVQNVIIAGIEFWLNHTPYNFVFVCKSGNHGRTSHTTRFSAETGHSLEYLMYLHLAAYFRTEKRVRFVIEEGIHSYLDVYEQTLRFHHGHAVKYGGGVGGITIPVNKAIAQWDKGMTADIDLFGHFHQRTLHRKFICNGSLIGYNGYAMSIKADYEPPMQNLSLFDKKRGRTCDWPILFTK